MLKQKDSCEPREVVEPPAVEADLEEEAVLRSAIICSLDYLNTFWSNVDDWPELGDVWVAIDWSWTVDAGVCECWPGVYECWTPAVYPPTEFPNGIAGG